MTEVGEQVRPPGNAVTTYPVMARLPSELGADQVTVDCAFSREVAATLRGADGVPVGVAVAEDEASDHKYTFFALTVNV